MSYFGRKHMPIWENHIGYQTGMQAVMVSDILIHTQKCGDRVQNRTSQCLMGLPVLYHYTTVDTLCIAA